MTRTDFSMPGHVPVRWMIRNLCDHVGRDMMLSALRISEFRDLSAETAPATRRIVMHMPGSGGELLLHCLARMDGIEIPSSGNENIPRQNDRSGQAGTPWCGPKALPASLRSDEEQRLIERTAIDWQRPANRHGGPTTSDDFWPDIDDKDRVLAIVRHPMQAWLGLCARDPFLKTRDLEAYLEVYAALARTVSIQGFVTYEGLRRRPILVLRTICELLELPYDRGFGKQLLNNKQLSEMIVQTSQSMIQLRQRSVDAELRAFVASREDYRQIIEILGYSDDGNDAI